MSGDPRRVYVGNLPFDADLSNLHSLLGEAGQVVAMEVKPHPTLPGKNRGWGTCLYDSEASASRAIAMINGRDYGGRTLQVAPLRPLGAGPPPGAGGGMPGAAPPRRYEGAAPGGYAAGGAVGGAGAPAGYSEPAQMPIAPGVHLPPTVKAVVASLSDSEAMGILSQMQTLARTNRDQARALLIQYPTLSRALLSLQERSGVLKTTTPKLAAAMAEPAAPHAPAAPAGAAGYPGAAAAPQHAGYAYPPAPGGYYQQPPPPQAGPGVGGYYPPPAHAPPPPGYGAPPAFGAYPGAPAPGYYGQPGAPVAGYHHGYPGPGGMPPAGAGAPPRPPAADAEAASDAAAIIGILEMSDAEVAAIDPEERELAQNMRDAVKLPLAVIASMPPERRAELLALREQLQGVGIQVAP